MFCRVRALGAGNLDVDWPIWGMRGAIEPVEVRTVLKLAAEPVDNPELYDLRWISGVVRDDEGVAVAFRGIIEGEREDARRSLGGGGKTSESRPVAVATEDMLSLAWG